jgi:hypothetical protein
MTSFEQCIRGQQQFKCRKLHERNPPEEDIESIVLCLLFVASKWKGIGRQERCN